MEKKLIDYEGFEAYAKGVKDKYAEKKDVITDDERKYLQLMNDGFELIRYGEAETLLQMLVIVECEKIVDKMKPHNSPAFRKLIDLCLAHNGDANKIVKDEKYTKTGFLGLLQEGLANYPQYQVKSHDGQNLKIDDIVRMWKQESTDTLIWVTKDMLRELQSNYTNDNALSTVSQKFVKQEKGKGLSTNDYTDEDKKKVGQIPDNPKYTDTVPDLTPYAKKETIPTKVSQLENDKTFKSESEIQSMIEKASSLKKEVVTSLPQTGKDDVIYLVKDDKGKDNNNYLEYLWLNGKYELIGSTQVDLSGYMTKDEAQKNEITLRHDFIGLREYVQKQIDNTLNKEKDKAIDGNSGTPITDNNTYTTPQYVNYVVSILATSRIEEYGEYTVKELEKKLNKTDIQEFTQQELEEAFK